MFASRPLCLLPPPATAHNDQDNDKGNNSAAYDGTVGQVACKTNTQQ